MGVELIGPSEPGLKLDLPAYGAEEPSAVRNPDEVADDAVPIGCDDHSFGIGVGDARFAISCKTGNSVAAAALLRTTLSRAGAGRGE